MPPHRPIPNSLRAALATPGDDYERRLESAAQVRNAYTAVAARVFLKRLGQISGRGSLARAYTLPNPHEDVEQVDVATYLRERLALPRPNEGICYTTHPANETASKAQAGKKRARGMTPGTPDLLIWGPFSLDGRRYGGLAIELKRRKGIPSDLSNDQQSALYRLEDAGWLCCWCKGAGPAVRVIELCYGPSWLP